MKSRTNYHAVAEFTDESREYDEAYDAALSPYTLETRLG